MQAMESWKKVLASLDSFSNENIEMESKKHLESIGVPLGQVLQIFRILITGIAAGPSMFEICELIGKDEVVNRMEKALLHIKNQILKQ